MTTPSDLEEFNEIVGSDRAKLEDVEYLKTVSLRGAIRLALHFNLDKHDRDKFLSFYVNVVHECKSISELADQQGFLFE